MERPLVKGKPPRVVRTVTRRTGAVLASRGARIELLLAVLDYAAAIRRLAVAVTRADWRGAFQLLAPAAGCYRRGRTVVRNRCASTSLPWHRDQYRV